MLRDGIIEPSSSPWNSPVLVIPKKADASGRKNGEKLWTFGNLMKLLPVISEILDTLGKSKYFSTIDCESGFLQVPVRPEDQPKNAFSTRKDHFQHKRMPFGLKGAPATFQRLTTTVISGIQGITCLVYLDDVAVLEENLTTHNERLRSF
jgi:hypothetical protein